MPDLLMSQGRPGRQLNRGARRSTEFEQLNDGFEGLDTPTSFAIQERGASESNSEVEHNKRMLREILEAKGGTPLNPAGNLSSSRNPSSKVHSPDEESLGVLERYDDPQGSERVSIDTSVKPAPRAELQTYVDQAQEALQNLRTGQ